MQKVALFLKSYYSLVIMYNLSIDSERAGMGQLVRLIALCLYLSLR